MSPTGVSFTLVEPTATVYVFWFVSQAYSQLVFLAIELCKLANPQHRAHRDWNSTWYIVVASLDEKTLIVARLSVDLGASGREEMARAFTPEA